MTARLVAYVGSRTTRERNARGEGLSVFAVDRASGALQRIQLVEDLVNPSFLALNRAGDRLYTVHGDGQEVSAFAIAGDGRLAFLNRVGCGGRNPVHLALTPDGRGLVVSNHFGGSLAVIGVGGDGRLGELQQLLALPGTPGPHRSEQPFSKPHFNPVDPSGRFVVVPDKGLDRIFSFAIDGAALQPAASPWVATREGAGPRHVAFHPRGQLLYCVNELDSSVTAYAFDAGSGALHPRQVLPTLPDSFTGNSRAAEIEVSADGRFLYASNRGSDSIAVFAIAADGLLRFMSAQPTGGRTPRFFALAPQGAHLYALNEDSDTIVRFDVDRSSGALARTADLTPCGSPVCMVFRGG